MVGDIQSQSICEWRAEVPRRAVRRLSSRITLGKTTIVCCDKSLHAITASNRSALRRQ